jgi:DHA3 family tetracycline resistance protein-like MFS transporter
MPKLQFLRALRHRPFALLWSGQTISRLGDSFHRMAITWWIVDATGSAAAMGTAMIFFISPMLVFLLVGGAFVDRLPRLRLMLASDLGRGALALLLAFLNFTGQLQLWHIYLVSLGFGFVSAFFEPAYRAAVPEITPQEDLPSANSLTSLGSQLSGILGPALAGGLVALGGVSIAIAIDGISFLISAACLLPIRNLSGAPVAEGETRTGMLHDIRQGLAAVFASPFLWVTIAIASLSNLAYAGPMDVALPFLIKDDISAAANPLELPLLAPLARQIPELQRLLSGAGLMGLFYSFSSLGAVAAALYLGRLARLRRRGLLIYLPWLAIGLLVLGIGWFVSPAFLLLAGLGMGLANALVGLAWTNALQEIVPRRLLGRVTSVDYLGSFIMLPVGLALGGWAAETFGAQITFIVGGLTMTLLVALGLLIPEIRRLD